MIYLIYNHSYQKTINIVSINSLNDNLTDEQKKHATEVSLDNYHNYDYEIDNVSNYDTLKEKIKDVLEENYGSSD